MSQHGRKKYFPVHIGSQLQRQRTSCLFYLFRKFLLIDVDSRPDHKKKAASCRLIHLRQNSADFLSVYHHVVRPFDLRIQMKLPHALRYGDRHQQCNHRHMRRFRLWAQQNAEIQIFSGRRNPASSPSAASCRLCLRNCAPSFFCALPCPVFDNQIR